MLLLLILVFVLLTYLYVKLKYFTLRGPIPGLSPHVLFGNLIQAGMFNGKTTDLIFAEFKRRFGNIFQFWLGPFRVIVVNNIGDVQHIFTQRHIYDQGDMFIEKFGIFVPNGLISVTGAQFKRHAALTLPLFRRGKIISSLDLIVDCVDKLLDKWRASPAEKFDYDLETLDDGTTSNNELTQALLDILVIFQKTIHFPIFVSVMYLKVHPRYRRARATIERYCTRMIEQELTESPESIAQRKRTSLIASLVSSLQQDEKEEAKKSEEKKQEVANRILDNVKERNLVDFVTELP